MPTITLKDWRAKGAQLYGGDQSKWRFQCPVCGYVATPADWQKAGAPADAVAFSCIGRYLDKAKVRRAFGGDGPGPCDYTAGGLFNMNPVEVLGIDADGKPRTITVFDFADESPHE